jgi:transcriptional regulator with XRE-family HTH domain
MTELLNLSHAKKLRYLRKSSDLKQTEISNFLNVSQQAYSDLENGKTYFTDEIIEKLSHYFKITPADFENPMEAINIGNNNNNTGAGIYAIDLKLIETLQKTVDQNTELHNKLIQEKDARIKLLEDLLNKKK